MEQVGIEDKKKFHVSHFRPSPLSALALTFTPRINLHDACINRTVTQYSLCVRSYISIRVHEQRHKRTDDQWPKLTHIDSAATLPIRIGLKQQNLEHGDRYLMEVADPTSSRYGKYWTTKEVIDAFKPR